MLRVKRGVERVARVIGGDTFETADSRIFRLANVWVPEPETDMGRRATRFLKALIGGKEVEVETYLRDRNGGSVAGVRVDGKSVNLAVNRRIEELEAKGLFA